MRGGYRTRASGDLEQSRPVLSVIIPTFNSSEQLSQAIESVLECGLNTECIVVDGASEDGTVSLLRSLETRIAVWISEPDEGVYDAMNKGIRLAIADRILFLGADDRLRRLEETLELLHDHRVIYYGNVWLPHQERVYDGSFSDYKFAVKNICHQSILYPRAVFEENSFELKYPILADHELNLKLRAQGWRFAYIDTVVADHNDQGGLSKSSRDFNFEQDHSRLVKDGFSFRIYLLVCVRNSLRSWLETLGLRGFVRRMTRRLRRQI